MVGGCVRDLLLDLNPKDFDIATEARPQQVKRAFPRNCRIIGRRFKLAHLHFDSNQKILEVATFRRTPPTPSESDEEEEEVDDADLLIVRDNEFGTVEEDALRRDFTINALFFDPLRDRIIDYVGGLNDVEARVLRTIGDPETRFREDPIRILRAARFAGRLAFSLDGPTSAAMVAAAPDLVRAAPPRILEEILRLLRGGHSLPSFQILRNVGGLSVLLPVVHKHMEAADRDERYAFWSTLDALDNYIHDGAKPSTAVLLACLFLRPILAIASDHSATKAAEEIIGPLATELRLPRRDAGALKRICSVQGRFTATGKRRFRLASFLRDIHFAESLELFALTCYATGENLENLAQWQDLAAETEDAESTEAEAADRTEARPRARKPAEPRRSRAKKTPVKKAQSKKTAEKRSTKRPASRDGGTRKSKGSRESRKAPRKEKVLTLEPEAYDLSAFDRELAPREIPRFDTIVESEKATKPRRRPQPTDKGDAYKPPPPPGSPEAPPPPPPKDDTYGDW